MFLVVGLATGPSTIDSDIIFPIKLASGLAPMNSEPTAFYICISSASTLMWGAAIHPHSRSSSKPNQVHCFDGLQAHFAKLATNPALFRSFCTLRLAFSACSLPSTTTTPSSMYTIILTPLWRQYQTCGLSNLVKMCSTQLLIQMGGRQTCSIALLCPFSIQNPGTVDAFHVCLHGDNRT